MTRPGSPAPIIFYDGECGLCQRFVQFVLAHDRRGQFRFAPLQGATAAASLPPAAVHSLESVILLDRQGVHDRSDASLRIVARLGSLWPIVAWLRVIPRPIRDRVYAGVARHRRWFGEASSCALPHGEAKSRFLP